MSSERKNNVPLLKLLNVTAFVAVWVTAGIVCSLSSYSYLLLGVPITLAFQYLVARRPLVQLWELRATELSLDAKAIVCAGFFMVMPAYKLWTAGQSDIARTLWLGGAIVGAVGCGNSVIKLDDKKIYHIQYAFLTAGLGGAILFALQMRHIPSDLARTFSKFVESFLVLMPVAYVFEEVSFRGAFDTYLFSASRDYSDWTTYFSGALWGAWHIPAIFSAQGGVGFTRLPLIIFVHTIIGSYLARSWRAGGSILAPVIAHAFADAVRNSLLR